MPKLRKRGARTFARKRHRSVRMDEVSDAIVDMEQPMAEIDALLWAFDLMSAGMRGRGDDDGGHAVAIVADCARTRLQSLKKKWELVFDAGIGRQAGER